MVQYMVNSESNRTGIFAALLSPERFKARAAHFPMQRDERTGMERATVGKSSCEAAS